MRRLTPLEAERLQGFPDNHTLIPGRRTTIRKAVVEEVLAHLRHLFGREVPLEEAKQLAADSPRYKAVGNSMAVPVVRWIGRRILLASGISPGAEKKRDGR